MSSYARINDTDFVNRYTLEQLLLPKARARYVGGTIMVSIPGESRNVPIKLLCDRFIELTRDRRGWSQLQEKIAATVAHQFDGLNKEGFTGANVPCCLWILPLWCYDYISPIRETIDIGNAIREKLLAEDPNIFKNG